MLAAPFHLDLAFGTLPNLLDLVHIPSRRASMLAAGTGILAGVLMLFALLLSDMVTLPQDSVWERRFRSIANGTFSIYLLHYPLLVLATIVGLLAPHRWLLNITTSTVIAVLLILLAHPLDLFKVIIRTQLRRLPMQLNPLTPAEQGSVRATKSA
jgi:peptidoglycan/LPS O-acetylase OafA/YrhL